MSYRKHHVKAKIKKLKPKKSILKNKWFWGGVLFVFFLWIIIYFYFFSSLFFISKINVLGNNDIKSDDIIQISENSITKKIFSVGSWQVVSKSIFLVNTKNIQQEIKNKFSKIEEVLVQKKLFQTLNIKIKEKSAVAIFCNKLGILSENCYFIDKEGIIFEELQELQNDFVVIKKTDLSDKDYIGQKVVDQNIINMILKVQKILKDNYNVDITDALITSPLRLNITTAEKWQIYLATDFDIDMQITKLNLLLKEEIAVNVRQKLQYIDLRFKDRAYYK